MLMAVQCTQCGKEGGFDLHLTFTHETKICKGCHHIDQGEWQYYFCDLGCMFKWLEKNKVKKNGFECRGCRSHDTKKATGFFAGFKQNGVCTDCKGKKRVKKGVVDRKSVV